MSEKRKGEGWLAKKGEKGLRFLRDINLLGAAALAGASVIAPPALAPIALGLATVDVIQAGGYELGRRFVEKRTGAKSKSNLLSKKTGKGVLKAAFR